MGLFGKISGALENTFKGKPLSYFARREGTTFHRATCDACGAGFDWLETTVVYPLPLSTVRTKPERFKLDVGGYCFKCNRMLCPNEADFVAFTHEGEDWWIAGCRQCQEPLGGRWHVEERKKDN